MKGLEQTDAQVFKAIKKEEVRQHDGLELIASENYVSQAVLEAMGSCFTNKYAEGYPKNVTMVVVKTLMLWNNLLLTDLKNLWLWTRKCSATLWCKRKPCRLLRNVKTTRHNFGHEFVGWWTFNTWKQSKHFRKIF